MLDFETLELLINGILKVIVLDLEVKECLNEFVIEGVLEVGDF